MIYANQEIMIATKHHKEKVIGPIFEKHLGCKIITSTFDTDTLGTFTGEVPRLYEAHKTCELKAYQAAQFENALFAVASEGSFGPHPLVPMIPQAHEIMVFIDKINQLSIFEHLYSQDTNYFTQTIYPESQLDPLLKSIQFPSHAVCIQTPTNLFKGIQSHETLDDILKREFKQHSSLFLCSDMRAMMNPTRMKVIETLAEKLVRRIQSLCPYCSMPGFGMIGVEGYLPCQACQQHSSVFALEAWGCTKCDYQEKRLRKDGKTSIEPQFCHYCNP